MNLTAKMTKVAMKAIKDKGITINDYLYKKSFIFLIEKPEPWEIMIYANKTDVDHDRIQVVIERPHLKDKTLSVNFLIYSFLIQRDLFEQVFDSVLEQVIYQTILDNN